MINAIYALCCFPLFQYHNIDIVFISIYWKYFISLKLHSEFATHRGEPVTRPLKIFGNVIFCGSIVVF